MCFRHALCKASVRRTRTSSCDPFHCILYSVALLLLGNGLMNTLLTLRGTSEGFSSALLGMVMSGYFVGFICGTWVSGRLIRRMGHIRTFAFCAAICASVALLHVIFVNPWAWLGLRFVYGLSFITLITVIESWLNSQAAGHERGRIFLIDQLHPDEIVSGSSDLLVMHGAGCAVAPLAAGSLMTALGGHALPFYIAGVLTLLGLFAIYRRRVSDIRTRTAHFEPMVQTSAEALEMIFDDTQPDLFDDPSFYEEHERQRLVEAVNGSR